MPNEFVQFRLVAATVDNLLGLDVRCFGIECDRGGRTNITRRLIGGIVQRDGFTYRAGGYTTEAFETSIPIPQGMSGAPVFSAGNNTLSCG